MKCFPALLVLAALAACVLSFPAHGQNSAAEQQSAAYWSFDSSGPMIVSPDGRFTLVLRSRMQLDTATLNERGTTKSGTIVRRAYLGVEGSAFESFWYELRSDFGGQHLALRHPLINVARLAYRFENISGPQSLLRINAGLLKPIFTYEDSVSSAALTFLERADVVNVATSVYGGGRPRAGVELTFQQESAFRNGDNFVVSAALTGSDLSGRNGAVPPSTAAQGTHILGRLAYHLAFDEDTGIQIGGSASHGITRARGIGTVMLQDYPEIRAGATRLVSTGPIAVAGGWLWGLEAAANLRNIFLSGEYYSLHVERGAPCRPCMAASEAQFSGWYASASWLVTGERKAYQPNASNNGFATFGAPLVAAPALLSGGAGAWEVALRFSDLDLNWPAAALGFACNLERAGCIRGGEQKIWTVGLNCYVNDNLRVMVNYLIGDVERLSDPSESPTGRFSAIALRLQFTN